MNADQLLLSFEKKAQQWLTELIQMSEKELLLNPAPGSWSMAEVYDHVMRVGRSYQIVGFKKSLGPDACRKKRKNLIGIAVFNWGIRAYKKLRMEKFPPPLNTDFLPEKRVKTDLVDDFERFIEEVKALKSLLDGSKPTHKHYHDLFGDINTAEWFEMIEIHMSHHEHQKKKIRRFLASKR